MKQFLCLFLSMVSLFYFASCGEQKRLIRHSILENVTNTDFSEYRESMNTDRGIIYYEPPYTPLSDSDTDEAEPEYYVRYTVDSYDNYLNGARVIVKIEITDPEVCYGALTVNSSYRQFEEHFQKYDPMFTEECSVTRFSPLSGGEVYLASDGPITFRLEIKDGNRKLTVETNLELLSDAEISIEAKI